MYAHKRTLRKRGNEMMIPTGDSEWRIQTRLCSYLYPYKLGYSERIRKESRVLLT